MENQPGSGEKELKATRPLLFLLAAACAATVANLYYIQPLLSQVAADFGIPDAKAGIAATATQLGYALGLFFFVPLGDRTEQRGLIVKMTVLSGLFLLAVGFSPNLPVLLVVCCALGAATVVPQLIVPLTAHISAPQDRGGNIGTVMSGLLIGILLSRTLSGFLGEAFGWRFVFRLTAALMLGLAILLRALLPVSPARTREPYRKLLASLWPLFKTQPVLREAAVNGFLMFGAFSAFWTSLVFLLSTPVFGMGSREAGLFGLAGAGGALIAPVVGRLADRKGARFSVGIGVLLSFSSYLIFLLAGKTLAGLIAGVILLDLGNQSGQVSNQARIQALSDEMRSRINTVFMVSFFLGGAAGSSLSSLFWGWMGWNGVCLVGGGMMTLALIFHFVIYRVKSSPRAPEKQA
ncbi:MFS transporter permease [Clostridium sp. W14A]|nr:MFS transporter permease [Clostridium sp. W14A]